MCAYVYIATRSPIPRSHYYSITWILVRVLQCEPVSTSTNMLFHANWFGYRRFVCIWWHEFRLSAFQTTRRLIRVQQSYRYRVDIISKSIDRIDIVLILYRDRIDIVLISYRRSKSRQYRVDIASRSNGELLRL